MYTPHTLECDGALNQAIVGRLLLEFHSLLEFYDRRFKGRNGLHLPRVIVGLGHDEV